MGNWYTENDTFSIFILSSSIPHEKKLPVPAQLQSKMFSIYNMKDKGKNVKKTQAPHPTKQNEKEIFLLKHSNGKSQNKEKSHGILVNAIVEG